jgi:hypothetical protein
MGSPLRKSVLNSGLTIPTITTLANIPGNGIYQANNGLAVNLSYTFACI